MKTTRCLGFCPASSTVSGCYPEIIYCLITKELSSLDFEPDVFCQFESRVQEFDAVYTCTAVPVFNGKRLRLQFIRRQPRIGRIHLAQKTTTTLFHWSYNITSLLFPSLQRPFAIFTICHSLVLKFSGGKSYKYSVNKIRNQLLLQ